VTAHDNYGEIQLLLDSRWNDTTVGTWDTHRSRRLICIPFNFPIRHLSSQIPYF